MITPDEITRKVANKYWDCVRAKLADKVFFPFRIPCPLVKQSDDLIEARRSVESLRAKSKDTLGFGYSITWKERNSRKFGRNQFPEKIEIDTLNDFLRMLGRTREFQAYLSAVKRLRTAHPVLVQDWLPSNLKRFNDLVSDLDDLLRVIEYFRRHPRPDCYAREIPVERDTKFIERHESLLRQWLDRVLPPSTIRAEESRFEPRFGLKWPDSHVLLRFLDPDLQKEMGFPVDELTLPAWYAAELRPNRARVIVVENKVNLLTLPRMQRTLVMLGQGHAVSNYRRFQWLQNTDLIYWGDIDAQGFEILSLFRGLFPHANSLFMDETSQQAWKQFEVKGKKSAKLELKNLEPEEQAAFTRCRDNIVRIEQEKIPHSSVIEALKSLGLFSIVES